MEQNSRFLLIGVRIVIESSEDSSEDVFGCCDRTTVSETTIDGLLFLVDGS